MKTDEEKNDTTDTPPDKRRKKSEEENHDSQSNGNSNGSLKLLNDDSMMSLSSIKSTQEGDLTNKMDYESNLQKEEKPSSTTTNDTNNDKTTTDSSYEKIRKENDQELEKKMHSKTLEKGHICFLYRPKVNVEESKNVDEVQRMYIVLLPQLVRHSLKEEPVKSYSKLSIEDKLDSEKSSIGKARVIVLGKKKMPEVEIHSKYWGYVDNAFNDLSQLKEFVSGRTYQTATKGQRSYKDCRIFGRGVYNIVEDHGHTHLAYVLEIPEELTEIQKEFNVNHEGNYIISIKNPDITNPSYTGLSENEKVTYPDHLMQKFQKKRFIPLETTEFLDHNGAELLFIGAKKDLTQDLGDAGKELEELAEFEIKTIVPFAERTIFDDLQLEKGVVPAEPLYGLWK
jgi:hypothetical protein